MTEEDFVSRVSVLKLEPGQVLVVTLPPRNYSQDAFAHVQSVVKRAFPDTHVLDDEHGIEFGVIEPAVA